MRVKHLIEHLKTLDPESFVMVSGYEGGYRFAHAGQENQYVLNVHTEWYFGPHEDAYHAQYHYGLTDEPSFKGVCL